MAVTAGRSPDGAAEIRTALSESRRLFVSIGLFSAFVNLLRCDGHGSGGAPLPVTVPWQERMASM